MRCLQCDSTMRIENLSRRGGEHVEFWYRCWNCGRYFVRLNGEYRKAAGRGFIAVGKKEKVPSKQDLRGEYLIDLAMFEEIMRNIRESRDGMLLAGSTEEVE